MSPEQGWRILDLGRSRHRQALRETGTATQEGMLSVFHFLLIISNIKDTLTQTGTRTCACNSSRKEEERDISIFLSSITHQVG